MQDVGHRDQASFAVSLDGSSNVADVIAQQHVEGFGVLAVDAFVVDVELGEERLVEQPAELRTGSQVGSVAITGEVERCAKGGFDLVERCGGRAESLLDARELTGDALLLACDQVQRYRPAVDRFHQLLALRYELRLLAGQVPMNVFGLLVTTGQLGAQAIFNGVA